jgi:hypothetical protein
MMRRLCRLAFRRAFLGLVAAALMVECVAGNTFVLVAPPTAK